MTDQPLTPIPLYIRFAKSSFALTFLLLFCADGLQYAAFFLLSFGAGLLAWTGRSTPHDRDLSDQRNIVVLILNTAFALLVFAFFPDHVRWPALRWIILAIGLYCAMLTAMLSRRQKRLHG